MPFTEDQIDELNLLLLYNLTTTQEGIKVHKSADTDKIAAAKRLYDKTLITQPDGGYLTDLGRELAEHTQAALTILNSK